MSSSSSSSSPKILILGAGPTGLGAALRCEDVGHANWQLVDCAASTGGLSRSFIDEHGFTWDLGGHVIFSHYQYFDEAMDYAVSEWNQLERESWVWVQGVWVPYPFQNNIHRLPNEAKQACLDGLLDVYRKEWTDKPANFEEYFQRQFGEGISRIFMSPYNFKVWAVPPSTMSTEWTGERVATVDVKRVCKNIIYNTDDLGWGPNATFRFPLHGGTGGIWTSLSSKLPQEKQRIGPTNKVVKINVEEKIVTLVDGTTLQYDKLISTLPFDELLHLIEKSDKYFGVDSLAVKEKGCAPQSEWPEIAKGMIYSATNVIGLGIKGEAPAHLKTKCWMYFPEDSSPFYRCTVFSNYSRFNAPEGHWSLMLEVSESSQYKPVDQSTLIQECVAGCLASNLLTPEDVIVSKWHCRLSKGYPTPFLGRNKLLEKVQPALLAAGVYSRGRFGGWRYEVANQDHSMMQGVEAVDAILSGGNNNNNNEQEVTYFYPNIVNSKKDTSRTLSLLKKK